MKNAETLTAVAKGNKDLLLKNKQQNQFYEIMLIHRKREYLIVLHSNNIASTCR